MDCSGGAEEAGYSMRGGGEQGGWWMLNGRAAACERRRWGRERAERSRGMRFFGDLQDCDGFGDGAGES